MSRPPRSLAPQFRFVRRRVRLACARARAVSVYPSLCVVRTTRVSHRSNLPPPALFLSRETANQSVSLPRVGLVSRARARRGGGERERPRVSSCVASFARAKECVSRRSAISFLSDNRWTIRRVGEGGRFV